jgi:hypothetical protein
LVTISIVYLRVTFFAVLLVSLAAPFPARAAFQGGDCDAPPADGWGEARTRSFAILYPPEYEQLAEGLAALHGEALDLEYARFEALFEASLALPISIRIYPDLAAFDCLNAQTAQLQPLAVHSHIGSREIALIGSNILADLPSWSQNFSEMLRYELGALFAEHTAGDSLPPGLLVGAGRYLQDPAQTIGLLQLDWRDWSAPTQDWRSLWEEAATRQELSRQLQAASIVAYLVDIHGWAPFLKFLQSLPASQSYRQSLSQAYGMELAALEDEWRAYFPVYFRERWQYNVLHNYDLETLAELVQAEEYAEADRQLKEAIVFLQKVHQPEKLAQAQALLASAQKGHEADSLVAQSRQAFHAGDYPRSLALLGQAEKSYARIGSYFRMDELAAYRGQVHQILALHDELARLQDKATSPWNTLLMAGDLVSLGRSLASLGDTYGHARVLELAQLVESRQREQHALLSLGVVGVILALLGMRVWTLRRPPAPEAQL